MAEPRKVYLIPFDQAARIKDIPDPIQGDAYSTALSWGGDVEGEPAWATEETLEGLKALGLVPDVQGERFVLPVFHGAMRAIETINYAEILSCIAYANFDEDVSGVAYVGCNCESELWQMHHPAIKDYFFYYSQNEMRPYIWIAVCTNEIAAFLYHLYHEDENTGAWLQSLGFDPLAEAEEGGE
jgi:hypothetical protein